MRHGKKRGQLNRFSSWRKSTVNSMIRSVLIYQSIKTTRVKAKVVKPEVEKLITLGKKNTLAAKRAAFKVLCDHNLVSLLFNEIAPRFSSRTGGYTRLLNLGKRRGDNADVVIFELTEIKKKDPKAVKKVVDVESKVHKHEEVPSEEKPDESKERKTSDAVKEDSHPGSSKEPKKFLGGIRKIFKKERDSL